MFSLDNAYTCKHNIVQLVFPAHAGMNRDDADNVGDRCSVPRTRGDEPVQNETI